MEDSRSEAAAKGSGKYLGKACRVCGCETRYTTNGNCVDCSARHTKAYKRRMADLLREVKQQRASR